MQFLKKLHQTYVRTKDGKAPDATKKDEQNTSTDQGKGRKPNFFERKRFLNYEKTSDSGDEAAAKADDKDVNGKKDPVTKEIKNGKIE